jgi:hypothetical protein
MIPVIDGEGEVRGHGSHEDFGRLDAALDFESTGRRVTAQKALHLMVRGSHVSGFILRPDDGLSDVAIVCNGAVRWLTPAEFQWLLHESRSPITMDDATLSPFFEETEKLRAENAKLREAAQEVVWSWREATGHEDLPQCLMVSRSAVEGAIAGLEEALT